MNERPEDSSMPYSLEKTKRHRSTFTPEQVRLLETEYLKQPYIGSARRKELAEVLHLSDRAIKIWYQNRRSKERKDIMNKRQENDSTNSPNDKSKNVILRRMLSRKSELDLPNKEMSQNDEGICNASLNATLNRIPDMIPLEDFKSSEIVQRRQSIYDNEVQKRQSYENTRQNMFPVTNFNPDSIPNPYSNSNCNPTSSQPSSTSFYNDTFQDTAIQYSYESRELNRYPSYCKDIESYKASAEFSIELFKKYIRKDDKTTTKEENDVSSQNLDNDIDRVTSSS